MANGVNKVILVGNLGKDPEVRYTQSGSAVCNLNLAIGERRKDGEEWREHTEWVRVVCFGRTAENVAQYVSKGRQIYVEGRMQTNKYTDKNGVDKWSTEVVAREVLFLGGRDGGGGGGGGGGYEGGGGGQGGGGPQGGGGGQGGGGPQGGGGGQGGGGPQGGGGGGQGGGGQGGGGPQGGGGGGQSGGGGQGGGGQGKDDGGFYDDDLPF